MDEILAEIVAARLNKLFRGQDYFSHCAVDALLELTGGRFPDETTRGKVRALHCVNYGAMSPELRAWLFRAVVDAVQAPESFPELVPLNRAPTSAPALTLEHVEAAAGAERRGLLRRLFRG